MTGSTAARAASSPPSTTDSMTFRSLIPFFIATFGLSWGAGVLYVVFQEQVEGIRIMLDRSAGVTEILFPSSALRPRAD